MSLVLELPRATPSPKHARSQANLVTRVNGPYGRRKGGPPGSPGGWWFLTEVEVLVDGEPLRPDVAGWLRERLPELSDEPLVRVTPEWICEILSPSNPTNDTVKKKRIYHRCQVPHYWIIDPRDKTLSVYRFMPDGYLEVLAAQHGERVRAEPFAGVELSVSALFDEEDEESVP